MPNNQIKNRRQAIGASLGEYTAARQRRREMFGPDLSDTAMDISQIVAEAAVDAGARFSVTIKDKSVNAVTRVRETVTKIKDKYAATSQRFDAHMDARTEMSEKRLEQRSQFFADVRRRFSDVKQGLVEKVGNTKVNIIAGYQTGLQAFKAKMVQADDVSDAMAATIFGAGVAAQNFANKTIERNHERKDAAKLSLADSLQNVSDKLRERTEVLGDTLSPTPVLKNLAPDSEISETVKNESIPSTNEKSQEQAMDVKSIKKVVKDTKKEVTWARGQERSDALKNFARWYKGLDEGDREKAKIMLFGKDKNMDLTTPLTNAELIGDAQRWRQTDGFDMNAGLAAFFNTLKETPAEKQFTRNDLIEAIQDVETFESVQKEMVSLREQMSQLDAKLSGISSKYDLDSTVYDVMVEVDGEMLRTYSGPLEQPQQYDDVMVEVDGEMLRTYSGPLEQPQHYDDVMVEVDGEMLRTYSGPLEQPQHYDDVMVEVDGSYETTYGGPIYGDTPAEPHYSYNDMRNEDFAYWVDEQPHADHYENQSIPENSSYDFGLQDDFMNSIEDLEPPQDYGIGY